MARVRFRKRVNACTVTNISHLTSASLNNQSPSSPSCPLFDSTANVGPGTVDKGSDLRPALSRHELSIRATEEAGEQTQKMDDLPRHRTSLNLFVSLSYDPSFPPRVNAVSMHSSLT